MEVKLIEAINEMLQFPRKGLLELFYYSSCYRNPADLYGDGIALCLSLQFEVYSRTCNLRNALDRFCRWSSGMEKKRTG